MTATRITAEDLARWRATPCAFIEECLFDPETGAPFKLLPAERAFLAVALTLDADGRLRYPEWLYGSIKKSGKTQFAAMILFVVLLLFGGRNAEGYVVANDLDQAVARVWNAARGIIAASPLLRREARVREAAGRITFPATGAFIQALTSNYASAAGAHPTITILDEMWAYVSERSRRLYDELIMVPTRKISCRLVVTHAGFAGESNLLEELYARGVSQPKVGDDLYAGDGLLTFWSHVPIAPWQTERWLADMRRTLRPTQFARMIENRFVSAESTLLDIGAIDGCFDSNYQLPLADRELQVFVGVDASTKHDATALVAVAYDRARDAVNLIAHRIFQPSPERPLDFQATIEQTLHTWKGRYHIKAVYFDPHQMFATAQSLARDGIRMVEYPQTVGNLTESSGNLLELIKAHRLRLYPAPDIRQSLTQAVMIESSRGWRIGKEKQTHKVDVVVALAMAAYAAVQASARRRDIRAFRATSADGFGGFEEYDLKTGDTINHHRPRLVRAADGSVKLRGSDNSAWSTEQMRRRHGVTGLY